jgi:hypothetical protein
VRLGYRQRSIRCKRGDLKPRHSRSFRRQERPAVGKDRAAVAARKPAGTGQDFQDCNRPAEAAFCDGGVMHRVSEPGALGYDRPESKRKFK